MMNPNKKKWADVVEIISGKNQKKVVNPNGKYPIYGSGGIIGYADDFLCEAGTTIVGRKGTINNPIFVNERFWNVDTAYGIFPQKELLPQYLYYFCQAFNFKVLDKSTTIPSLSKRDLLNIEMPVPPLVEQERIVLQIEELFSNFDAGVEILQKARHQVEVYRQAVLKNVFSTQERKHTTLGEVIEVLTDYHANGSYELLKANVKLLDEPNYAIMIRSTNFEKNDFTNDLKYIDEHSYNFLKKSQLFGGEVLMGKIGNAGRVYYMKDLGKPVSLAMNMFAMRFKKDILSKYVYYYLLQPSAQEDIRQHIKGVGTPTIDKKSVRSLKFDYPINLDAQEEIVRTIECQFSICEEIERKIDRILLQAESLRQSILKNAFEGRIQA